MSQFTHYVHLTKQQLTLNNGVLLVAGLITLSWLWGTIATLQKNFQLEQQVSSLDQEIEVAELRTQNVRYEQNYLRSDEFLELEARKQLNKAAPGETVILLPRVDVPDEPATTPIAAPDSSNFQEWIRFFFGRKDA